MSTRRNRKQIIRLFSWVIVIGLVSIAGLAVYCSYLFKDEITKLMEQQPATHPTLIYSDVFFLKKGDTYENTFLTERLKDLRIPFRDAPGSIEWKGRAFDYPEDILPASSQARVNADQTVHVEIKDERVDAITIDGNAVDAVALEPTPVAQLAGATREIREYVKFDDIPAHLPEAIMAIEDQRFLEHHGFDPRSLARAIWANVRTGAFSQGGSTLTQQLVKNLLDSSQKTLFRKVRELLIAIMLDTHYDKKTIMEKYLNEVYFGQIGALEVHGVSEAAKYFYNKKLEQLTVPEMALIAGVVRGPAVYSPYRHSKLALARKDVVLKKMAEQGYITKEELREYLGQKIAFAPPNLVNNRAPYFVDYVKAEVIREQRLASERERAQERSSEAEESESEFEQIAAKAREKENDRPQPGHQQAEDFSAKGWRIFTTIDLPLQRRADQSVATTIRDLEAKYKIARPLRLEGILVAADPQSGSVKALVGGRSYAETTYNRVLNMKRQIGSTFKPFAYLSAFLKGKDAKGVPYSGAYMIDDEPWSYKVGKKNWSPRNYERGYRGHITLREAFANSLNIPMAKVGVDVGIENVIETADKLGIPGDELPKVPSLVLGSVDLRPIDLLQAYTTLANRGTWVELSTVRVVLDENGNSIARFKAHREERIEPKYVDLVNDILSSVVKEGTAKMMPQMGYSKPARGKTGTTSFSRDAWFAGFSQGLVTVTWTGFDELKIPDADDDEAARKFKSPASLTGAGAALPTWARFYAAAKPAKLIEPDIEPDPPLERMRIDKTTGLRARSSCPDELVYEEVFLPDTAPSNDCNVH